jgi:hypothetical protein
MGQALEGHGALPHHVSKQEQFEVDREKTSHEQSPRFHASIPIRVGRTAPLRALLGKHRYFFHQFSGYILYPCAGLFTGGRLQHAGKR